MQLRDFSDKVTKLGGTIVVVQREDKLRGEGLKRTAKNTKAEFIYLDDYGKKTTAAYSKDGFSVYIIDAKGFVRNILKGTKTKRPDAEKIVARLAEIKKS